MYRFLTNFRWIRKLLGRNWKLIGSSFVDDSPIWFNWDIANADPKTMSLIDDGFITILERESYE